MTKPKPSPFPPAPVRTVLPKPTIEQVRELDGTLTVIIGPIFDLPHQVGIGQDAIMVPLSYKRHPLQVVLIAPVHTDEGTATTQNNVLVVTLKVDKRELGKRGAF